MKKITASVLGFFAPMLAFAQSSTYITNTTNIVKDLIRAAFIIIPALAILFFFWELIGYIRANAEDKEKKRAMLLYSVLALFIIFSAMGIIKVLQTITNTGGSQQIQTSQVPGIVF
jgi:heme O synthase-like polyprenyltransferase